MGKNSALWSIHSLLLWAFSWNLLAVRKMYNIYRLSWADLECTKTLSNNFTLQTSGYVTSVCLILNLYTLVEGNLHMFAAGNLSSRVCDHLKKNSAAKRRNKQITENLAREEGLGCIFIPPTSLSVSAEVKNITVKYCREAKTAVSRPGRGLTDRVTGCQKWRNHQPGESIQGPRAAASVSKRVYCSQKLPEKLQRHTHTIHPHSHPHFRAFL